MMEKIDKQYVSEIDKKMAQFNETHPLSAQQKAERDKYQHIYRLRDVPTELHADEDHLWK
jgi:hypothetical protein